MGIYPPSDLILDMMRASRSASEIAQPSVRPPQPAEVAATEFTTIVREVAKSQQASSRPVEGLADRHAAVAPRPTLSPGQQLEAVFLGKLLDSMLPKDAESFFGSGTAGSMWRSMLAEKLGEQLARTGGIGIAEKLVPNSPPPRPAAVRET